MPSRNPVEIMCPLPPQFYITDPETNANITRTLVLFAPVVMRTTIMWVMWISNILLAIVAVYLWATSERSPGVKLLKNLPSVKLSDQILFKRSDLSYIMELVYINRQRLQFVK